MTQVKRPDDVRQGNRLRILTAVRRGGETSRTGISRSTGLSAATVSAITSDLLDEGSLASPADIETQCTRRGRPKVTLTINPDAALIGTVVFQLNRILASLTDFAGNIVGEQKVEIATLTATPAEFQQTIIHALQTALTATKKGKSALVQIAVGVQGVTDIAGATMMHSPMSSHRNLPIKEWLEEAFGVPTQVSNDCDTIAQALNWRDPERYGDNFAAVLLAHGVGMGLFLRGRLINGTRSSGTELGHMIFETGGALCRCGNRGCIEAYAGDYAISRQARGETEAPPPPSLPQTQNMEATIALAQKGDKAALAAFEKAGTALGTGIANIFALVDPFPIVLVGNGAKAFAFMEVPIRNALAASSSDEEAQSILIDCIDDEEPLVREGCAIQALLAQDMLISAGRSATPPLEAVV